MLTQTLNRILAGLTLLILICAVADAADRGVHVFKTWIPMPDGVRLAATLYMPADLHPGERVPALLEYLPYRKDDDQAPGDYGKHAYFARHGYVGARVDLLALHLLRRHVIQRTDDHARLRERSGSGFVVRTGSCLAIKLREAEIQHLDPRLRIENVAGFQVPVDDMLPMRRVERSGELYRKS